MPASFQAMAPRSWKEDCPVHMRPVDGSGHQVVGTLGDSDELICVPQPPSTRRLERLQLDFSRQTSGRFELPVKRSGLQALGSCQYRLSCSKDLPRRLTAGSLNSRKLQMHKIWLPIVRFNGKPLAGPRGTSQLHPLASMLITILTKVTM